MAMRAEDLWAVSPEDFLAGERDAKSKSEWVGGVVYCALETLHDYWIVDPDTNVIEAYHRAEDGWHAQHHTASAPLQVTCLDLEVRVVDVVGP